VRLECLIHSVGLASRRLIGMEKVRSAVHGTFALLSNIGLIMASQLVDVGLIVHRCLCLVNCTKNGNVSVYNTYVVGGRMHIGQYESCCNIKINRSIFKCFPAVFGIETSGTRIGDTFLTLFCLP